MTHFRIEKGTVRSFNGNMAICSPIALDLECTPKAETLVRAISNCQEEVVLSMTAKGRLKVHDGLQRIRWTMERCTPHGTIRQARALVGQNYRTFQKIAAFVGNDAARPWTNGILLRGQSAFATNNVCLVELLACNQAFHLWFNIPGTAVGMGRVRDLRPIFNWVV